MSRQIGITKEVKEKTSFEKIMKRLYPILDDIGHNAVSIKETHYIWGKEKNRDMHYGFEMDWADNSTEDNFEMCLKLGALVYFINKEFKGAKAVLTINGETRPVYYGAENAVDIIA